MNNLYAFFNDIVSPYFAEAWHNPITMAFMCIILGYFLWALSRHLLWNVKRNQQVFQRASSKLRDLQNHEPQHGEAEHVFFSGKDIFPGSKKYQIIWDDYTTAWSAAAPDKNVNVSAVDVDKYFSNDVTVGNSIFLRRLDSIPGRLLSLGILGTFVGLSIGMGSLPETGTDPSKMGDAVFDLVGGLNVAFMTSILGIMCSLFFLIAEKRVVGLAVETTQNFYRAARVHFPPLDPEQVLSRIAIAAEQQTDSLRTLENDLAATLSESFGGAIEEHLAPLIEQIHETVSRATDTSAEVQIEGVQKLVNEFMSGMQEKLGDSFQELGSNIESASNNLGSLSDRLETSALAQMEIMEQTAKTAEVLDKQLPHLLAFGEQLSMAGHQFKDAICAITTLEKALSEGTSQLISVQQETEARIGLLITQLKESSELSTSTSTTLASSQERMERAYREALESFEQVISNGLLQSLTTFDSVLSDILERFSGTLADLKEQYEALDRHSRALKEGVETVSTQISSNLAEVGDVSTEAHLRIKELSENYVQNMERGLGSSTETIDRLEVAATSISTNLDALQAGLAHIIDLGTKASGADDNARKGWRSKLLGGSK